MSFVIEDEEDVDVVKKPKLNKNPDIDTSFLPDKDREARELRERAALSEKWKLEQELVKSIII